MSRSDIWALLYGHETPAWVVPSGENTMALRRGDFGSRGNRHIHLTGTGMPLCGVAFETGPRSASVVQSMAVRTRSHPSGPFPLRDVALPRPPLLHAPIVDRRCVGAARRDCDCHPAPLRKRVSSPASSASCAKSLKLACPLGTVSGLGRGEAGRGRGI